MVGEPAIGQNPTDVPALWIEVLGMQAGGYNQVCFTVLSVVRKGVKCQSRFRDDGATAVPLWGVFAAMVGCSAQIQQAKRKGIYLKSAQRRTLAH